jgi:GT2 family glycosyltransferase/glycosyltransferase involved in cell wall biosynthesis
MPSIVEIIVALPENWESARRSIDSVLSAKSKVASHVTVVRSEPLSEQLAAYLGDLERQGSLSIVKNGADLGFAAALNEVIRAHPTDDVIFLNCGAIVSDGWLDVIGSCKDRFQRIGTISSSSNSAGIAGYPRPWLPNPHLSITELDKLPTFFSKANGETVLEISEPHATCVFLPREAIRVVGGFSESIDNGWPAILAEWSERASQQGLKHFLCAGLFIQSNDDVSAGSTVANFSAVPAPAIHQDDTVRTVRRLVDWERLCRSLKPRVLLITHRQGGGVERHVADLSSTLEEFAETIILRPAGDNVVSIEWSRTGEDWRCWFDNGDNWRQLRECLKRLKLRRIHLHHVDRLPAEIWTLAGALKVPLDITLHDHWPITSKYHLQPREKELFASSEPDWQRRTRTLLESAARIFSPSKYLADAVHAAHPDVRITIWPHYTPNGDIAGTAQPKLKVALLGRISVEKGLNVLMRCAEYVQRENLAVHFRIIGPPAQPIPTYPNLPLDTTGSYDDANLAELIAIERPDVIFFPSQVPESFSYTLTAAMSSGVPIVAADLGALSERLMGYPKATLLSYDVEPVAWCGALLKFFRSKNDEPNQRRSRGKDKLLAKYLEVFSRELPLKGKAHSFAATAPLPTHYFPPKRVSTSNDLSLTELYQFGVTAGHAEAKQELVRRLAELDQRWLMLTSELQTSEDRRRQIEASLAESLSLAERDRTLIQELVTKREALDTELRELSRQLVSARADHHAASQELNSKILQLEVRKQQFTDFESSLLAAREAFATKAEEVEVRNKQLIELDASLVAAREAFATKAEEVEVRNRQLRELEAHTEATLLEARADYDQLETKLNRLQSIADELQVANNNLDEDNRELKTLLVEAEGSVKELSISNRELALVISVVQGRLDEAERSRAELQAANTALDNRTHDLVNDIERLNRHIKQLDAELFEKQQKFNHVLQLTRDTLENERDSARAAFAEISGSKFWRITSPLRLAAHAIKSLLIRTSNVSNYSKGLPRKVSIATQILREEGPVALGKRVQETLNRRGFEPDAKDQREYEQASRFETLTVPQSARPKVSIVIPVYGQHLMTFTCLRSIAATCADEEIEVIVIDDCSPEPAADALTMVSGVKHIRNSENLGFLRNCNKAAALATGQYVLLLNNDVIVTQGWLQALVGTFSQRENVGMVGAKLVYPDGRLQEAGGIVWRDGSAWNWGRDQDASRPEFNYLREVDYCSGAVLLLERAFWNKLGGFDERYAPAYYEDTDLAFRVREAEKSVFYQPNAVVVHFEGKSSGTDVTQGIKRYQVINQETFVNRWTTTLGKHRINGQLPRLERDRYVAKRVLVVDACMLTPDQDSGSLRMFEMLGVLAKMNLKVTFFADNLEFREPYVSQIQALGVEVIYHPVESYVTPLLERIAHEYDVIMLSRATVAVKHIDTVKRAAPEAKVIFDTVDLHFLRQEREAELADSALQRAAAANMKAQELSIMAKSDLTVVVSPLEQKLLAEIAPDIRVSIVSNIHVTMPGKRSFDQRSGAIFIGGFRHPPNLDAITWYVENVLPILRRKKSGIVTTVIGSNAPPRLQEFAAEDFVIAGFVQDVTPFYDNAKLSFSPLRYGAGVKGKVNIAMQYGVPVVATSPSVEGMHLRHEQDVLRADTPEAFAEAMIRLDNDRKLWGTLRANGLTNIETHFSRAAARIALSDIVGLSS